MESCILCLEINKDFVDSIKTNSTQWQEYQVAELIEKHFWPLDSLLSSLNSVLCLPCWQELNSFHKFYMRIKEAHVNLGRPIKIGGQNEILEKAISSDNEDDKEFIQYGLLEPEILIDRPVEKQEEIEMLCNIKIEPQDENLVDTTDVSNKDPLKKPIKTRSKSSKRKIEAKCTSNSPFKITKVESIEIKKENPEDDNDSIKNDDDGSIKTYDQSDSEDTVDKNDYQQDSDFQHNTDKKIQKIDNKPRTKRKENDQFISQHLKDIVCDLCKTNFETFAALRQHFSAVHKQNVYVVCCNRKFSNRTRLVDHLHTHLNPDHLKCKECGRVMSESIHLERHMLRFHGATELEKKHCDVCQKPFVDGSSLRIHKLTHLSEEEKDFPCEECGKFYATSYLLKMHKEAVHLKKFVKICYICGKAISSSTDYKMHMNKHEGIPAPDISCDVCGLRLASERGLKRHKESQHPVGGKKEHPCPICPKVSPTVKALKKHINTMHEKGYDHKCTICDKAFKRADGLREHMASHTGTALYTCPWCPKTFNSNGNMHAHRKKVHPKEWEEEKLKKYSGILPQQFLSTE